MLTVYMTPNEVTLLDALRAALAARTVDAQEHSRSTLVASLVRQEVDRLRHTGGDLPREHLNALTRAAAAVDGDPEPARRQGRPPTLPGREAPATRLAPRPPAPQVAPPDNRAEFVPGRLFAARRGHGRRAVVLDYGPRGVRWAFMRLDAPKPLIRTETDAPEGFRRDVLLGWLPDAPLRLDAPARRRAPGRSDARR